MTTKGNTRPLADVIERVQTNQPIFGKDINGLAVAFGRGTLDKLGIAYVESVPETGDQLSALLHELGAVLVLDNIEFNRNLKGDQGEWDDSLWRLRFEFARFALVQEKRLPN